MNEKESKLKVLFINIIVSLIVFPTSERFLTPVYDAIINNLLSAKNTGLKFISDFIYSRISEGVYVNIPFYIFIVIVSLLLGLLICSILLPYKKANSCCDADSISSCPKRKRLNFLLRARCFLFNPKRRKLLTSISCIVLYALFLLFVLTTNFVNLTITRTTNNIEILAPYISDQDYKILKSNFHSISSRSDFDSLTNLLNKYATNVGVELK